MTTIDDAVEPALVRPRPSLHELATWTLDATDVYFDTLPGPRPGELHGVLRGGILAAPAVTRLPHRTRRLLYRTLLRTTLVWLGKSFDGSLGANHWWTPAGSRPWLRYRVDRKPLPDGSDAVMLDYDLDTNPGIARQCSAEIRRLVPGEFVGRMSWRSGDRTRRVLYFFLRT